MSRKSLLRLWEENERLFGGRTQQELEFFAEKGMWPEQRGHFNYWMEQATIFVEWRNEPDDESVTPSTIT